MKLNMGNGMGYADIFLQVEYFKKQRVVNYQKEQTIKKIEREGGEIVAPQLPTRSS